MEKKNKLKALPIVLGSALILIGILILLIPSLVTPNYKLYKGGENVTSKRGSDDTSAYQYNSTDSEISFSEKEITIKTEDILKDNSFLLGETIMFSLSAKVKFDKELSNVFLVAQKAEINMNYNSSTLTSFYNEFTYSKEVNILTVNDLTLTISKDLIISENNENITYRATFTDFALEVYKA